MNFFGVGRRVGAFRITVVKKSCNMVADGMWEILFGPLESIAISPIPEKLDLNDDAAQQLHDALIEKNKCGFVSIIHKITAAEKLDPAKVAYEIIVCLEAIKSGSSQVIKKACLNIIGAQYLKYKIFEYEKIFKKLFIYEFIILRIS